MTEQFNVTPRSELIEKNDADELAYMIESAGGHRETIRQLVDQIDATDMHKVMTMIAREGDERDIYATADLLQKCIAIIQVKLARIQGDIQREEQKKIVPQARHDRAEAELNAIYIRRVAIASEMRKLQAAPNSIEQQVKLQELKMEYAVTSVKNLSTLLDERIEADTDLIRLNNRLSTLTEHETIRVAELAEYDLQLKRLTSKSERVVAALAKLASAQREVAAITEETNDAMEVALPQNLPDLEADRPQSLASINHTQAGAATEVSVDNLPFLKDEAISLAVSSSTSSITIPLRHEATAAPATESSLEEEILKAARANSVKPATKVKRNRLGKLLESRTKR